MKELIGRSNLSSIAVTPALYLVLHAELKRKGDGASFTEVQLHQAFGNYLRGRPMPATKFKDDLSLAKALLKKPEQDNKTEADKKKKSLPVLNATELAALKLMNIQPPKHMLAETPELEQDENAPAEELVDELDETEEAELEDELEFDGDELELEEYEPNMDLQAELLDFAREAEPGDAVAAVMMAQDMAPSADLGIKSVDILLDKYGSRATTSAEKTLLLDGIAASSDAKDRNKFRPTLTTMAQKESDPASGLQSRLFALAAEDNKQHALKSAFVGMGREISLKTLGFMQPREAIAAIPVVRKRTAFDVPMVPSAPKPPTGFSQE